MTSYRDAAVALWGEAGAYAHDAYHRWRPLYSELPDELPIVIGITAYGACIGLTRGYWLHGPRITIASNLFSAGRAWVDDVMVHEMLHCWLHTTGQDPQHQGNAWYTAVRRLSTAVLGHDLDVRRGSDRRSVRVPNPDYRPGQGRPKTLVRKARATDAIPHSDVARWPSPFRAQGYDWGEPIPCPTY